MSLQGNELVDEIIISYYSPDVASEVDRFVVDLLMALLGFGVFGDIPVSFKLSINSFYLLTEPERFVKTLRLFSVLVDQPSKNIALKKTARKVFELAPLVLDNQGIAIYHKGCVDAGAGVIFNLSDSIFEV